MTTNHVAEKLIAKYTAIKTKNNTPFLSTGTGIFLPKTRKRLLGIKGLTGRDRTKHDFWFDQRNRVERGLIDLQLFIDVAEKKNVNKVVNAGTLKPLVGILLRKPVRGFSLEPDPIRAWIAQLFIEAGFYYLERMCSDHITLSHKHTIEEAIDLSRYLARAVPDEKTANINKPTKDKTESLVQSSSNQNRRGRK